MLTGSNKSTSLRLNVKRPPWICRRCFHAQIRLLAQQSESEPSTSSGSRSSSEDVPLSPIEAFRRRYVKAPSPTEPNQPPTSPTDRFRSIWAKSTGLDDGPPVSNPKALTLGDLATAYREHGASRNYRREEFLEKEAERPSLRKELRELIERDEMGTVDGVDVFEGENLREYQGVLPLEGREHVQQKFSIKMGAVVESRAEFANIGVIVSDRYLESHRLCYAVSSRGKLHLVRPSNAVFVLPDFAPLHQVSRIDKILHQENSAPTRPERIPLSPKDNGEEFHELINSVALRLHQFKLETERALNEVRRAGITAYELLKNPDSVRTTSIFTPDAAKRIFNTDNPSYAELYATHKLLADDAAHFIPDTTRHIDTATFLVRAPQDVELNEQVVEWIRGSSPQIESFLEKSQKLITISRSLPPRSIPTLLNVEIPPELYFTDTDRMIIDFIAGYVTGRRAFIPTDTAALMPTIIKRSGMYPTLDPDRDAAKLFLTEIGVWQPSESLPALGDAGQSVLAIFEDQPVTEIFVDANEGCRHDFGDMPVYTIDDASAHELDDGISIERTPDGDWLHIHIANPSAFITPDSQVAGLARLRQTTLYLPDNMRPMLPIHQPEFKVSGFARELNEMPTMTFSARLADDGDIAEYKVRPGIVRNVKILTYDNVDDAISTGESPLRQAWWTASYIRPDYQLTGKKFDAVTFEIAAQLRSIEDIIRKHREWRIQRGALRIQFPNSSIQVNPTPLPNTKDTTWPTFIRGNAGIMLSLGDQSSRSRSLIEEMMIIANRVAGLFGREHNIPVAYRGLSTTIPTSLIDQAQSLHLSGVKQLPSSISRQILSTSGGWLLQQSTTPKAHELLGITAESGGYVQVTSPMRRYLDVLAHWQFGAFLRGDQMPFSLDDLSGTGEYSLLQASRRLFRRRFFSQRYSQFYAAHAVSQLLVDPTGIASTHLEFIGDKPRLTGFIIDQEIQGTSYLAPRLISVKELGIHGFLFLEPGEKAPGFEDEFPVEISGVNEAEGQVRFRMSR